MLKTNGEKPSLAITIRSFSLDDSTRKELERVFTIGYCNTTGKRLSENELILAIRHATAVIAGTEFFSRDVLDASPELKIISRVGVGTDSIDMETANRRNIRVMITAAATVQPVAEHTLALIFSVSKRIAEYYTSARCSDFAIRPASLLQGKTAGIIGMGRIGSRVGELLSCLGCRIIFYDPYVSVPPKPFFEKAESPATLFSSADIISLHIPAKKGDRPILDREAFNQCRPGVIIINTARGSLIDEKAMYDALKNGRIAGAGIDVTAQEPYSGPLLSFPRVIITPHVASNTTESRISMEHEAVENIMKAIKDGQ